MHSHTHVHTPALTQREEVGGKRETQTQKQTKRGSTETETHRETCIREELGQEGRHSMGFLTERVAFSISYKELST